MNVSDENRFGAMGSSHLCQNCMISIKCFESPRSSFHPPLCVSTDRPVSKTETRGPMVLRTLTSDLNFEKWPG